MPELKPHAFKPVGQTLVCRVAGCGEWYDHPLHDEAAIEERHEAVWGERQSAEELEETVVMTTQEHGEIVVTRPLSADVAARAGGWDWVERAGRHAGEAERIYPDA